MTKLLAFKTIAFDTNTLSADVPILTHEYFKDHYAMDGDNVTKEVEEAIIKWILGSPAKELFLSELRVWHNSFIDYNVKLVKQKWRRLQAFFNFFSKIKNQRKEEEA